jgi:hypothetical protein
MRGKLKKICPSLVFENRALRRIPGPKREEDGSWRKLHIDELDTCILHRMLLG